MADAHLRLTPQAALARLVPFVLELESQAQGRVAFGFAGGPGSGKSTLAPELVAMLNHDDPARAALVPMDGFRIKHARLEALGHTERKGAPHTFEANDFPLPAPYQKRNGAGQRAPYSRGTVSFVNPQQNVKEVHNQKLSS